MTWFFLALLAPFAWSIANYLDKYILSRPEGGEGGSGGLLVLSSFASGIVALVIFIVNKPMLAGTNSQIAGALILAGIIEGLYLMFYFFALERESTTTVISLAQLTPIFGLVFGYLFLHEIPSGLQFAAVALILLGTLFIIFKKGERFFIKANVLFLMLGATIFIALYNTIFKFAGEHLIFWTAVFWEYLGIFIFGVILFVCIPPYRKQLASMLTARKGTTLVATGLAELMNIIALLATNAAVLLAPVALVLSLASVQPVFVFIEGLLLAAITPRFFGKERPSLAARYIFGIILVCVGGFLVYQSAIL